MMWAALIIIFITQILIIYDLNLTINAIGDLMSSNLEVCKQITESYRRKM